MDEQDIKGLPTEFIPLKECLEWSVLFGHLVCHPKTIKRLCPISEVNVTFKLFAFSDDSAAWNYAFSIFSLYIENRVDLRFVNFITKIKKFL